MELMRLSINEPFLSPAWGSNFVVFSSEIGEAVPESEVKAYISKCCRYAKHHGVYLVPERILLSGYHSMIIITPEGRVSGSQKGTHRNLNGRTIKRSSTLELAPSPFGGIFLCVDVDIYHPEIPRLAAGMGADFIIGSQIVQQGDYDTNLVLLGAWSAAQNSGLYVASACNQFNCVCAPRPLTENKDGFVVSPRLKMPLTAKLDAGRLGQLPRRPPLSRQLYAVHRDDLCSG